MMRALYTSATGMMAQQMNMDVIANNLANVNTTGFKRSRADFEDLLYQEMRPAGSVVAQGATSPTGIEVGLGVKAGATVTMFDQGTFQNTGQKLDVAIEGDGFYKVLLPDGTSGYTRDGAFKRDAQGKLVNSDGMAIQPEITIPDGSTDIAIGKDGTVNVTVGNASSSVGKLTLTRFANPAGLEHIGGNNFKATDASGSAVDGTPGQEGFGSLSQGILEMSNVQIVQEMVNMITAQRAYETNSKSIQTADEMLSTANQLKH
ncbi:MAG: flagellar basal-body rod protein FlgG [Capsulimonas sp.]|uniref:flagellar basal-body rod protein FlgG n=1 Tax=Capsulimonas sp. TaxID=2494211 RepID=UPI00326364FD